MTKPKTLQSSKTPTKTTIPNKKNNDVDIFGMIIMAMLILPIMPP